MVQYLKKVSFVYMADTPWSGLAGLRLYLQSGQFTSTLKTSQYVGGVDNIVNDITYDETNTPWIGNQANKLYLQSGQFTSTLKDSESTIDTSPTGISWDGADTPWTGTETDKLYLQSGQFTSTIKTSESITTIDGLPMGISYDGNNTPWIGDGDGKLYLQSGQFTSTLKDSEYIFGIDDDLKGISFDGTDTLWTGREADKLYLQSGQFTSTLKDSEDISGIDTSPTGICTNDVTSRLSGVTIYERSVSNTITFGQIVSQAGSIFSRSVSNTITLGQIVADEKVGINDTPWCGYSGDKLYLQSGQFTSTLKTSEYIGAKDAIPYGIDWDGINTPWIGLNIDKLFLTSGQFTSTIKDSESVNAIDLFASGISWDDTNTPWCGYNGRKLYLQSGQFTSTLKTSQNINSIDETITDISFNGIDTPWCGATDDKLYLQSAQFTSTLKTSEAVGSIDISPTGITWDGTNTPWCGLQANKLYLQSGKFTSTLKTSEYIGAIESEPSGITTNNYVRRLHSIYEESVSNTITFGQVLAGGRVYERATENKILFCHDNVSQYIVDTIKIHYPQFEQILIFNQEVVVEKVFGIADINICRQNLARWILASVTKYFSNIAINNSLHYFVEGTQRYTKNHQKSIEFRMDGPDITQISKGYYRLNVEINILWSFNQDDEDFHETERIKGILMDAMEDICIYRFGDGPNDDDSFIGTLQLKQNPVRVNNFGQVRKDVRLIQGTVEGSYNMYHSC